MLLVGKWIGFESIDGAAVVCRCRLNSKLNVCCYCCRLNVEWSVYARDCIIDNCIGLN